MGTLDLTSPAQVLPLLDITSFCSSRCKAISHPSNSVNYQETGSSGDFWALALAHSANLLTAHSLLCLVLSGKTPWAAISISSWLTGLANLDESLHMEEMFVYWRSNTGWGKWKLAPTGDWTQDEKFAANQDWMKWKTCSQPCCYWGLKPRSSCSVPLGIAISLLLPVCVIFTISTMCFLAARNPLNISILKYWIPTPPIIDNWFQDRLYTHT